MKIRTTASLLRDAVKVVAPASTETGVMPILADVLLESINGRLRLSCTNLNIGITFASGIECAECDPVTVPTSRLLGILSSISQGDVVELSTQKNSVTLRYSGGSVKLPTSDANVFHRMDVSDVQVAFNSDVADLFTAIHSVLFCVSSSSPNQPACESMFMSGSKDVSSIRTIGTNMSMISLMDTSVRSCYDFSMMIPKQGCESIVSALKGAAQTDSVEVGFNMRNVVFDISTDTRVVVRMAEGKFLPYEKALGFTPSGFIQVDRKQLMSALSRVSVAASNITKMCVMTLEEGSIVLSSESPENGLEALESVTLRSNTGRDVVVGFNIDFMQKCLSNMDVDSLKIGVPVNDKSPIMFYDGDVLRIQLMPLMISK